MNKLRLAVLTALFFLSANQLLAHALWIEAKSTGKVGQAQEVKVFYGEYATKELEETGKWYSDVKDFTLWLTAPGKEKIKLTTVPGETFYSATFTPEKDGLYHITVSHVAKELGGTTKYEFLSVASVAVGKANAIDLSPLTNSLKISANEAKTYKANAPVQIKALLNGQPLVKKQVSVFSPEGWSKEYTTDENGNLSFSPIWPGRYVLEVSNFEKVSGDHNGKTYSASWQGATSSFEVSK